MSVQYYVIYSAVYRWISPDIIVYLSILLSIVRYYWISSDITSCIVDYIVYRIVNRIINCTANPLPIMIMSWYFKSNRCSEWWLQTLPPLPPMSNRRSKWWLQTSPPSQIAALSGGYKHCPESNCRSKWWLQTLPPRKIGNKVDHTDTNQNVNLPIVIWT